MITILGYISEEERGYVQALRELIPGVNLKITTKTPALTSDISLTAKLAGAAGVFVTVPEIGERLVARGANVTTKYSQSDFAGSLVKCGSMDVVLMDDLSQIRTTSTGKHLAARWLSKITAKDAWPKTPEFRYELCNNPDKAKKAVEQLASADFIAYDIETIKHNLYFDVIGFTGVWISKLAEQDGPLTYTTRSFAFPHSDEVMQVLIQQVLQNPVKKIAQNGKYDNAYLIRWGMPPVNWICDTAHFFHSWYCELPKRLDFITAYCLRDVKFWKDDGEGSFAARAEYCGRDTWATACTWMSFMERAPDWAFRNYVEEFTVNPACILAEHTGLDLVPEGAARLREYSEKVAFEHGVSIAKSVGNISFNPNSPKQVLALMHALGSKDLKDTKPPTMDKFATRHPLNQWFADNIKQYKSAAKVLSNYLKDSVQLTDHAGKVWPKVFYCLNPHGTETGRLASKEHHFWCGLQVQNIKRDEDDEEAVSVKEQFAAPAGFYLGEADYEQAESRDTAYLSGDPALIKAVDCGKDFHSLNASAFFGVPYEEIYRDLSYTDPDGTEHLAGVINKALRTLAKRVNHGANYNMGPGVLLDTMGIRNCIKAKMLLKLPVAWSLLQVCEYLLMRFSSTYHVMKNDWYSHVVRCVRVTHMLTGPTGWTRYCFGDPSNKRVLNSYVAHPPQSLNAKTLNRAWKRVFREIAMVERKDFRLNAQIHDSILFSYRVGRIDLAHKVKKLMEIPIQVTDPAGITRTLLVPSALKGEHRVWAHLKDID